MLVLPLNDGHDRQGFDCGDADLNRWLQQTARQHKEKGVSSTFVAVTVPSSSDVLGYYAVSWPNSSARICPLSTASDCRSKCLHFGWTVWLPRFSIGARASVNTCCWMPLTV